MAEKFETWVFSNDPTYAPRSGVVSVTAHETRENAQRHADRVNGDRTTDRCASVRSAGE